MKTPKAFIEEWMEAVCSNDVNAILSLYKKDGLLLGTLDSEMIIFYSSNPVGELAILSRKI